MLTYDALLSGFVFGGGVGDGSRLRWRDVSCRHGGVAAAGKPRLFETVARGSTRGSGNPDAAVGTTTV